MDEINMENYIFRRNISFFRKADIKVVVHGDFVAVHYIPPVRCLGKGLNYSASFGMPHYRVNGESGPDTFYRPGSRALPLPGGDPRRGSPGARGRGGGGGG